MQSSIQKKRQEDRRVWTEEQDRLLVSLVGELGTGVWAEVARRLLRIFPHIARTGKQCRERYCNHLDPRIVRSDLSEDEQKQFAQLWLQLGNKWTKIAQLMQGRTESTLKNFYYSNMRRAVRVINEHSSREQEPLKLTIDLFLSLSQKYSGRHQFKRIVNDMLTVGRISRNAVPSTQRSNPQSLNILVSRLIDFFRQALEKQEKDPFALQQCLPRTGQQFPLELDQEQAQAQKQEQEQPQGQFDFPRQLYQNMDMLLGSLDYNNELD